MSKQSARPSRSELVALIWERCPSKYQGSALVFLLKIAGLTKPELGYAYPRTAWLAKACGLTPRSIQYITKRVKRVMAVQPGRHGCNRYVLLVDELRKLPVVCPRDDEAETEQVNAIPTPAEGQTAETTAPAVSGDDALPFAKALHGVIRRELKDAQIPDDWQATWPKALRTLLDKGHKLDTLTSVARFAIDHEWWSMELAKHGAHALVQNFDLMLKQWSETKEQKQ